MMSVCNTIHGDDGGGGRCDIRDPGGGPKRLPVTTHLPGELSGEAEQGVNLC
jgi:hypothetical protein